MKKKTSVFLILGIVASWALACGLFALIFLNLVPFITSLIPKSDWKAFMDLVVYVVVGWAGGIALPLSVGLIGTGISLKAI